MLSTRIRQKSTGFWDGFEGDSSLIADGEAAASSSDRADAPIGTFPHSASDFLLGGGLMFAPSNAYESKKFDNPRHHYDRRAPVWRLAPASDCCFPKGSRAIREQ